MTDREKREWDEIYAETYKRLKIFFIGLGITVAGIVAVIILSATSTGFKTTTVAGENGEITIYYKSFKTFGNYVKCINDVACDNEKTLLDCNFPDMVYYQDKNNGTQYSKKITSEEEYIEMLNYFYFNDEFEVNKVFLPKYVCYTKN